MFSSQNSQVSSAANYIEDVFSTYLYTGTGASQTITNGIDLSTKGGLVWIKSRASGSYDHQFVDTTRGSNKYINSNNTNAETTNTNRLTTFNTDGFALGASAQVNEAPASGYAATYASWTFRKQPKFFDVVTYTGNGASSRTIAHSLGSIPGCIIVKGTSVSGCNWAVYHRSTGADKFLLLNTTDASASDFNTYWGGANPTSTNFSIGSATDVNQNGTNYVAYLFAHNAGGFGLTGTDNVISCGSFTTDGSGNVGSVNLGYEPQWILTKSVGTQNWYLWDTMRGDSLTSQSYLSPNLSNAESTSSGTEYIYPTATGFSGSGNWFGTSQTVIYIAIRRGPMKVPTSGTSVFAVSTASGEPAYSPLFTAGFSDMTLHSPRVSESGNGHLITDRLRGNGVILETPYTNADNTISTYFKYDSNDGAYIPNIGYFNNTGGTSKPYALRAFKRAPSFFDEVCYTGTGSSQYLNHALGVDPELIICKKRSAATSWGVQMQLATKPFNGTYTFARGAMSLDSTAASTLSDTGFTNTTVFNPQYVTDTSATYGTQNASGATYVAYLFATCAGVSKVGSYTGTGTTKQIDCGFTGGARFVLIKRTDSTGDWYVWDTARGIVSGNDPYLLLNSTDAEVTNTDYVDTYSAGFEISSTAPAAINASGGTFIFLAIA